MLAMHNSAMSIVHWSGLWYIRTVRRDHEQLFAVTVNHRQLVTRHFDVGSFSVAGTRLWNALPSTLCKLMWRVVTFVFLRFTNSLHVCMYNTH